MGRLPILATARRVPRSPPLPGKSAKLGQNCTARKDLTELVNDLRNVWKKHRDTDEENSTSKHAKDEGDDWSDNFYDNTVSVVITHYKNEKQGKTYLKWLDTVLCESFDECNIGRTHADIINAARAGAGVSHALPPPPPR